MNSLRACLICRLPENTHSVVSGRCSRPRAAVAAFVPEPRFDEWGNRVNEDGSLWNLDGKLAARNGND